MRLIDADALKARCGDWYTEEGPESGFIGTIGMLLDREPTVGGWISVKDRLPIEKENPLTQDFAEVICYCDFGGIPKRTDVRVYKFGKRTWTEEGHFWLGGQCMDGVITHWMPLPEPPKEEKHND